MRGDVMRLSQFRFNICNEKNKIVFILTVCVCCILASFLILDSRAKPFVYELAVNKAKAISVSVIEDSVKTVLQNENVSYDDLVILDKTEQGNVTSIRTNMVKTNILKADISSMIVSRLEEVREYDMEIPLGALMGSELFSSWGPNITIPISLTGRAIADIKNEFTSAGINQTLHHIWLELSVDIYIMLPGDKTDTNVSTRTEIAQTIIVGVTPDAYLNTEKILTQK